jgi:hypothetical protein
VAVAVAVAITAVAVAVADSLIRLQLFHHQLPAQQ